MLGGSKVSNFQVQTYLHFDILVPEACASLQVLRWPGGAAEIYSYIHSYILEVTKNTLDILVPLIYIYIVLYPQHLQAPASS